MKNIKNLSKIYPLFFLLSTIAAYLPLASRLGFYWDDWPMLYFKITRGASGFAAAFDSDRPFLANLYQLTSYLPNDPIVWQILTIITRYLITLSFWWLIRQIWKNNNTETFWIAVLLSVYPGFKQMPIVYVWLNGFILLLAYILSFCVQIKSLQQSKTKNKVFLNILSLLFFSFCIISTEYYVGFELCRGVLLYLFFKNDNDFQKLTLKKKLLKILYNWAPYILIMAAFMIWRIFIFKFPGYQPVIIEEFFSNPFKTIINLIVRAIEDAYTSSWGAWIEYLKFPNHTDYETKSGKAFWLTVSLSLIVILSLYFVLKNKIIQPEKCKDDKIKWSICAIATGLFMLICPGLPFWSTSLPVRLSYPYDRFLVTYMFGSCIFVIGLITYIFRTELIKTIILSIFVSAAIGGNILNANSYAKDWNIQKDFIFQLKTRIPELKAPTILLSDTNPLAYESDNSMTGMVNLAFSPDENWDDKKIPYSVMLFTPRFNTIEEYEENNVKYQDFRGLKFSSDNDNVIVYHYSPPSCLRIIDPDIHGDLNIFPANYKKFIHLSNPKEQIIADGYSSSFIFDSVFNQYPTENWCYYFQKAELARQTEQWELITEIGEKALPSMAAADKTEYFVFAEAFIHTDKWDKAGELFGRIHHESEGTLDYTLCDYIHKWIKDYPPPNEQIDDLIKDMNAVGCSYTQ